VASAADVATFRITTMDCAVEEGEIRRALEPLPGIRGLKFQLRARTLAIDADPQDLAVALEAIRKAGFDPKAIPVEVALSAPLDDGHDHDGHDHGDAAHDHAGDFGPGFGRMGAALAAAGAAEAVSYLAPAVLAWQIAGMAIAAVAIWLAGFETFVKGLGALRRGRLNINALMTVAVIGAFLLGQWPEAAMVMALYGIAELIEARSVDRARDAITGLLKLAPATADTRQQDGTWRSVPVSAVPIGAVARIKPGERIPMDGVVASGSTAIDQAPVTGESMPVDKTVGDAVFAGTINQTGAIEIRVTAAANDSTLARIIHAVEAAQGARAPMQRFVDRFAAIYTPAVFAIAVAVAVLMPLLAGMPWPQAAYKALVLLVIACPCALVISTPITVVSGLAAAARKGILIKGGIYLEQARKIKAVALDKTGTVTEGKPRLVHRESLASAEVDVEALAASLAARSDHPVSKAIAAGLPAASAEVLDFEALPGRGVQGRVDGRRVLLGNHALLHAKGLCDEALEARIATHESAGRTVTLLAAEDRVLALFAVADTLKATSTQAVAELRALGVSVVMLTGDNAQTARVIATEAGIADARGDLLPQDKQSAIQDLQRAHGVTAMIGDGINDAPSLAQADIGFAMGGAGTDIAMEAADVVIMNDDLRRVASTIGLSRKTHAVLWQNIALALGIKAVFLVLAVFGSATMWMAVFADMGASLLVVGNGLRLLRS
jgi:Cd2+/Zn2+-exporting ATPase